MRDRFIVPLFLIALVAGIAPARAAAEIERQIGSESELRSAISNAPRDNTPVILTITQSFNATGAVITVPANANITLVTDNENGVTITRTSQTQRQFTVNGTLNLGRPGGGYANNITLTRPHTGSAANPVFPAAFSGGVNVGAGGTFNMYGGTISGARFNGTGGGVHIVGTAPGGAFNMHGGSIKNNAATGNGGGVVVHSPAGRFTKTGGEITGNTSAGLTGGGGVFVAGSGVFAMSGGSITGNRATGAGNTGNDLFTASDSVVNITGSPATIGDTRNNGTLNVGAAFTAGTISNNGTITGDGTIYGGTISVPVTVTGGTAEGGTWQTFGETVTLVPGEPPYGYEFCDWLSPDVAVTGNAFVMPLNRVTITARWRLLVAGAVEVTFNAGDGVFTTSPPAIAFSTTPQAFTFTASSAFAVVSPGALITNFPLAERDGYRIFGWTAAPGGGGARWDSEITADITLYAIWVCRSDISRTGDTNGDGRVTSLDATILARWLAASEPERAERFRDFCTVAADINGDGAVTLADLTLLARWLVGHNVRHLVAH